MTTDLGQTKAPFSFPPGSRPGVTHTREVLLCNRLSDEQVKGVPPPGVGTQMTART